MKFDHQFDLLANQAFRVPQRDFGIVPVVHNQQFRFGDLGRRYQSLLHLPWKRGILSLCRVSDAMLPVRADFRQQPVLITPEFLQEPAGVERKQQPETHSFVEAGARDDVL